MTYDEETLEIIDKSLRQHFDKAFQEALHEIAEKLGIGPQTRDNTQKIRVTREEIESLTWYQKGGIVAPDDAKFAYRFVHDKEGKPYPETLDLVHDIQLFGEIRLGPFTYKLGGDQGQFINRILEDEEAKQCSQKNTSR